MRARRPQRKGPLPGFSLALPAASTRSELQVLQQDENDVKKFFIHADDTLISPIITTDPQFSSVKPNTMEPRASELAGTTTAESGSAAASSAALPPPSKFIHVHNTNLFVLMDGVPMFLDNQSTFTGEEDIDVIQEKVRRRKAERLLTRAADVVGTDTVEEAIRDIEKDDAATHAPSQQQQHPFSQTSTKAVAAAPPSVTSSISALGNWNTFARTHTEGSLHLFNRQAQHSSTATAGGGPRRSSLPGAEATLTSKPSLGVPDNFAALFSNAKKPKTPAVFRQTRLSAQTSATNTSTPSSSTYTATPLATPPSALPVSSEPNASTSAGTAREGTLRGSSSNTTQQLRSANQPQQPNHTSSQAHRSNNSHRGGRGGRRQLTKSKIITADEIGHSNPSLDMDEVNVLHYIGDGSQGKVYCVMLEGKYFALKRLDAKAATEATNSVERQGRKRGLVKELNMIRLQRSMVPPQYLMQMFNAVAKFDSEVQELNILMELMSFGVEDAQQMAARIPHNEMLKVSQANFRQYVVRKDAHNEEISRLMKQQYGPCTRVIGRRTFNIPEDWEMQHNRQTTIPEIVLSFLAADVLRGLQELHRDYHMVHCDLKPANVLLCFDKLSFKLADFGCSCVMDHNTQRVRRQGVDLGTKLYKAPERIANEGSNHVFEETAASLPVEALAAAQCVEFSGKSDVWSLGIMLLELASGVHPCTSFKSDFWNYQSQLRLSKMIKPVSWSAALCDFVVRCICVEERRWSVDQLLVHPFIKMYNHVPRAKLKSFMERLENDSADFQRRHQLKLLEEQIQLSTTNRPADLYQRDSRSSWRTFTAFLAVGPELKDMEKFPPLT